MKKVILSLIVLGAIGFTSCKDDDSLQQLLAQEALCDTLWDQLYDAESAYFTNQTTTTCEAYRTAAQAVINSGVACVDGDDTYLQGIVDTNCAPN